MNFIEAMTLVANGGSVTYLAGNNIHLLDQFTILIENIRVYKDLDFTDCAKEKTLTHHELKNLKAARFKGNVVFSKGGEWLFINNRMPLKNIFNLSLLLDINNWRRL